MRYATLIDPRGVRWSIAIPDSRRERMRGLRSQTGLAPNHGMLFRGCRSVHTFGMTFEIEVAFLDGGDRVIQLRRAPPGRVLVSMRARAAIECAPGCGIRPGDLLRPVDRPERQGA